ncbi:MAG TPA: VacB/RNase II family 3'-5' exoribonuclease [Clostridia bacterium]|nr:VacB/RNase II family 3'-5' exoribonuclease [Clostridia bacterium]
MISEQNLLRHIENLPHRSAGYKQLIRELSLRGGERRELEDMLEDLVRRGRLVLTARDRYSLPTEAANRNLVAGRLSMHRDGYGFVSANDRETRERLAGDVFIPPAEIEEAMHGDQVLVELKGRPENGRAEGRILRVMTRAHATVVGTFHYGPRHNYVRPMDEKVTMDVIIPHGAEYPAAGEDEDAEKIPALRARHDPRIAKDRVIGSEAKRREWDDLEGIVVDVEITDWPTATQNPRGRVIEILGYEDDFGVDVEIVIRKHHLPHRFPVTVLAEAQRFDPVIPSRELRRRRDFRDLPIVTIDGETARDFDDAVTVERLENGNYELQVHIADVAHYVRPGSAIDVEALIRGTSVYFPDRAIPMLPVELSTDICSLRPKVDRLVLSCVMEIDPKGEIVGYELCPGVIRSAERMTYTDVAAILEGDKHLRQRYAELNGLFELMQELALILNEKRRKRGSIDFDLPEPVIEFDEQGLMQGVTRGARNIAHRIIEEFMLAANETVATYLEQKGIASIYRIHEPPDAKRVYEFENLAATFGYSLGVGALPVDRFKMKADHRARRGTGQRARDVETPKQIHITPKMYQKLTDKLAGKPEERILSYLMLRSLKQARYSELNDGHFALAATTYTHFTSPIRRYPDLLVHRILKGVLGEDAERVDGDVLVGVGGRVVQGRPATEREGAPHSAQKGSPWARPAGKSRRGADPRDGDGAARAPLPGPIPEDDLRNMAEDTSQSERRADEAERELLEWKKVKFMQDRVGEDFDGLVVSVTKFGMFVELTELFIEGLVPLQTMSDDRYTFHENTRQIIGQRTKKAHSIGDRVRVIVDRIDPVQRRINFAVLEERPSRAERKHKRAR